MTNNATNINTIIENDNNITNSRNKQFVSLNKTDKFKNEQLEVLNEIKKILNITNENQIIYFNNINNDNEIKNKIIQLENKIKIYFKFSTWTYFKNLYNNKDREISSLIKSVFKACDYRAVRVKLYDDKEKNNNNDDVNLYIFRKN